MDTYCLLCLLPLMTPPEPLPVAPGGIDTHAAVMHLVRQKRITTVRPYSSAERDAIVDLVPDELRGPDLTGALERLGGGENVL